MANEITRQLQIDVAKENTFQAILAKQYDKSTRYILAEITNLGEPITVDAGSNVLINFLRPDKTAAAFMGEVVDGKVKVPIPYWALELDGEVETDISLTSTDSRLTTLGFKILVEPATYDGNASEGSEDADFLLELIEKVSGALSDTQEAKSAAESSAQSAESAAQSASKAQTAAEDAASAATTSATKASEAQKSAESANTNAQQSATAASGSAQSAATAASSASSALDSANKSAQAAEKSADEAEQAKLAAQEAKSAAESSAQSASEAAETLTNAADDLKTAEEVLEKTGGILDNFNVSNTPAPDVVPQYNANSNIKTSKPIRENDCVRLVDILSVLKNGSLDVPITSADGEYITDANSNELVGYMKIL